MSNVISLAEACCVTNEATQDIGETVPLLFELPEAAMNFRWLIGVAINAAIENGRELVVNTTVRPFIYHSDPRNENRIIIPTTNKLRVTSELSVIIAGEEAIRNEIWRPKYKVYSLPHQLLISTELDTMLKEAAEQVA